MADSAVSSIRTEASTLMPSAGKGLSDMRSEDFFKLLVAELQNQDPMEPMKNEQMVQQISMIRDMEMSMQMTSTLESLTEQQRFGGAAALIGKYVEGTTRDDSGEDQEVSGVVTAVRFGSSGTARLELDTGETLALDAVTKVTTLDDAEAEAEAATAVEKVVNNVVKALTDAEDR